MNARREDERPFLILVIEDDEAQLKSLIDILELEDLHPIGCQSAQAALAICRDQPVNVAILDLRLPDMDGLELLRKLREQNPQIKIIINTGYASLESAMAAVNEEAFAYVRKMGNVEELLAHIHRAFHLLLAEHNVLLKKEVHKQTQALIHVNGELERTTTQREEAETALQESEERYRRLVELSFDTISIHSDRKILYINEAGADLYGATTPEELIGRSPLDLVHPDDRVEVRQRLEQTKKNGKEVPLVEEKHMRLDGSVVNVETAALPITYQGNTATLVVIRDISQRKRAQEALVEEHNLLRTLIDNLPDYIYVKDARSRFVLGNEAMLNLVGVTTQAELIGKTSLDFFPGALGNKIYTDEQEIMRSGKPVFDEEKMMTDRAGHERRLLTTRVPLLDSQGGITGLIGIGHDITDQKKLEDHLRQTQRIEALGRLAGGIAHDFNNLLTVITGYSELLLHRLGDHDPLRKYMAEIYDAGERAAGLTRQLLAFSRKQVLKPKALQLNDIVANTKTMLQRLIGEDIELITLPGKALGQIKADPGQIEQVIMNLAVNARDAMPRGGKLTIETSNVELDERFVRRHPDTTPGRYIKLAVSDTGEGMDSQTQLRIFEPFYTTKEQGKGTGLGLSMVHGIVKQSEGHIIVNSQPQRGTTFTIYLPRVEDRVDPEPPGSNLARTKSGTETILLVEDEDMVRELARRVLRGDGYTVLVANQGANALRISHDYQGPIHLLVTDVVMPGGMSGRDVAERLASIRPEMKVLFMSGYTDDVILHHGVSEASGIAFLEKPFLPQVLAHKVREVLNSEQ